MRDDFERIGASLPRTSDGQSNHGVDKVWTEPMAIGSNTFQAELCEHPPDWNWRSLLRPYGYHQNVKTCDAVGAT